MSRMDGVDVDTEDNYILSCVRPAAASKFGNIQTEVRLKQIPPLHTPGVLSFHYFCGNLKI